MLNVQPSHVHQWVATVLEQAEKAFQSKPGRPAQDPQVGNNLQEPVDLFRQWNGIGKYGIPTA